MGIDNADTWIITGKIIYEKLVGIKWRYFIRDICDIRNDIVHNQDTADIYSFETLYLDKVEIKGLLEYLKIQPSNNNKILFVDQKLGFSEEDNLIYETQVSEVMKKIYSKSECIRKFKLRRAEEESKPSQKEHNND